MKENNPDKTKTEYNIEDFSRLPSGRFLSGQSEMYILAG
jgi:hypothetical protein